MQKLEIFQVSSFAACQTGLLQETTNSDVSSFSRTSGNPILGHCSLLLKRCICCRRK